MVSHVLQKLQCKFTLTLCGISLKCDTQRIQRKLKIDLPHVVWQHNIAYLEHFLSVRSLNPQSETSLLFQWLQRLVQNTKEH